ncbi:hypothetical protein PIB30_102408, partial [Stylosanthes scabra]|nr:hypothetical protein [Stylosanthes scabra]
FASSSTPTNPDHKISCYAKCALKCAISHPRNPIRIAKCLVGSLNNCPKDFEWVPSLNIRDDSFFLVGHSFMALFLKNWASRLARNIAPTRELESFGPSLRVKLPWYLPSDLKDFRLLSALRLRFRLPFFRVPRVF